MTHTILVVEDDPSMRKGLVDNLEFEGYQLMTADNGEDGLRMAMEENLDLVLLDVMLPQIDGISLCRRLREANNYLPVIMLTARGEEIDKVVGLEVGADDYLTKPFGLRELFARIRTQLRRVDRQVDTQQRLQLGSAVVNFTTNTLEANGQRFELNQSESDILQLLSQRQGKVVTREEFINQIEQGKRFSNTRTLDNCMVRLRRKLEQNPTQPRYLITVHGAGYRLVL